MHTGWSHTRMDIFTVLPLMVLVFVLAFDRGLVARALQTRLPQVLGEWSYAIYLGQTAWLQAIRFFEQRLYPAPDTIVLGTRFSTLIWWLEPSCAGHWSACCWGGLLAEFIEMPAAACTANAGSAAALTRNACPRHPDCPEQAEELAMAISFQDKVAIVTGAGGGLGRAHALELARRGAKVVVNDLGGSVDGTGGNSAAAEKVVAEIKAAGGEAIANGASVTDDAGVAHLVKQTMDAWGRIDILIANAGILRDKSFAKMEIKDFEAVMDVHLMGTVKPAKAVWEIMKEPGIWPHRGDHLVHRPLRQFRPDQLRRGQAVAGRLHEFAEAGRRQGQYQGQRHLPGGRHPHDGKSDAAGGAGNAQAGISSRPPWSIWPAKMRRPA